eukprot:6179595-Amphidinium_carterae.1
MGQRVPNAYLGYTFLLQAFSVAHSCVPIECRKACLTQALKAFKRLAILTRLLRGFACSSSSKRPGPLLRGPTQA